MGHLWLAVLAVCVLTAMMLYFSLIVVTLRTYSFAKLQEACKSIKHKSNGEHLVDAIVASVDRLAVTCTWCRLIAQMTLLFLLMLLFNPAGAVSSVPDPSGAVSSAPGYGRAFAVAVSVFALFSMAIPHAWAKYAGEQVLCKSFSFLSVLAILSGPIIRAQQLCDDVIRRLAGVAKSTPQEQHDEKHEEFLTELEQRRLEGAVDEEEQEMIENVLELSDSTADQIMTPRTDITAVEIKADLQTLLDTIATAGHTRVPVYEKTVDNIVGLVYAKDLLQEIGKDPTQFKLRDKIRDAYFVPESKPLRALLHEFKGQKLHIAIVLDEYGGTAGIVTLEDILEELVGEIVDEYEEIPEETMVRIDDRTIEADARSYVDDLNDRFELQLPEHEDYDTIGGFVFTQLGYIPKAGESFDYQDLKVTILSAEIRKVKRVRIQQLNHDTTAEEQ